MVNKMNWMNTSQFVLFNCWTHLCQSWQERCSSCCKPLQHTTVSFLRLTRLPSPFDHLTICLTVNSHFSSRYWNQTACESFSKCTKRFELSHKSITFHGETLRLRERKIFAFSRKTNVFTKFNIAFPPPSSHNISITNVLRTSAKFLERTHFARNTFKRYNFLLPP